MNKNLLMRRSGGYGRVVKEVLEAMVIRVQLLKWDTLLI